MRVAVSDRITDPDIEESILEEKISLQPNEDTEVLLVWHQIVDRDYIDRLSRLRHIIRYGVGYDKIDVEYASSKGIIVSNTPDYCTDEVSDTALAYILASSRGIMRYNHEAKSYISGWQENVLPNIKRNSELRLGIIGAGRIGSSTILKAKALKYNISFFDPYLPSGVEKVLGVERNSSLKDLLESSDIVSLHTPLTAETRGIVDKKFISMMKPGSSFINTARGAIVQDLDVFYEALETGYLENVMLDVLPVEPPHDSRLFRAWKSREDWLSGRLLINPHSAFYSQEAGLEMRQKVALNARQFLTNGQAMNVVNS